MRLQVMLPVIGLLLALVGLPARAGDDIVIGQQVSDDYTILYLARNGWQFHLYYVGGLTNASAFQDAGLITMNCLYFKTKTGVPQGMIRSQGKTLADDGRRFGTAFTWNEHGWQLQPAGMIDASRNGFLTGPTLIRDGQPLDNFDAEGINPNRLPRPRFAIGHAQDGSTVIVMTRKPFFLKDFAKFLTQFNLKDAVNLDGGSSAFMYVAGEATVATDRQNIAALAIEPVPAPSRPGLIAPATLPQLGMTWLTLDPAEYTARAIFLTDGESVEDMIDRWNVKPTILFSPCLFDTRSKRTMGTLISGGQQLQDHHGPKVGYAWGIDERGFFCKPCLGTAPAGVEMGGCGPAYLINGRAEPNLTEQGYTRNGGIFTAALRTAIGTDAEGRLLLAASTQSMTPEQFSAALQTLGARSAVGLTGGQRALLYANGTWYRKPRGSIPYVIAFWKR